MKHLILLFLILGLQSSLVAKDWTIDQLATQAVVFPDGTIEFRETRTYTFDGRYTRADIEIRKRGFDRLYDIQLFEDGVPMLESDSRDPGTFRIRDRSSRVTIAWRYVAEDETKTFELRYKVAGAIVKGPEHSELFWTYIGNKWERSTLSWTLDLQFASGDSSTTIPVWAEGDTSNLSLLSGMNGEVSAVTGRIARRDGIRVRSVFPSSWIAEMPITDETFTLDAAIVDEDQKAQDAMIAYANKSIRAMWFQEFLPILLFGPFLIFGYFYHRFGRRFKPSIRIPETGHTPPSDLPPAVVSWLMTSKHVTPIALVATLLDLARRGKLEISTIEEPQRWGKPKMVTSVALTPSANDHTGLQDFEIILMSFLKTHGAQESIRLDILFKEDRAETMKWYMAWGKMVKDNGDARGFYDTESTKGVTISAILCGILIIVSIFAAFHIGTLGGLAIIIATLGMLFSFGIYRRTELGEITYRVWLAYKNGLKSGNTAELSGTKMGTHVIYAVAFGLAGVRLASMLSNMDSDPRADTWLTTSGFATNPTLFASQVSGMVASASAGVTAATGASSGSAGGGGGGGAS